MLAQFGLADGPGHGRWGIHVRQEVDRFHHVGVVGAGDEEAGLDTVQLVAGVDMLGKGGMVG